MRNKKRKTQKLFHLKGFIEKKKLIKKRKYDFHKRLKKTSIWLKIK